MKLDYEWVALSNTLGVLMVTIKPVDHPDRAARHLPRDPGGPAPAGQHELPALDDPGLPRRHGGARREPRPARRQFLDALGADVRRLPGSELVVEDQLGPDTSVALLTPSTS